MGSIFQEKQMAIVTYNMQLVMQKWNALEVQKHSLLYKCFIVKSR